jgi:hypothetical protein
VREKGHARRIPVSNAEKTDAETHTVVENVLPGADKSEPEAQQAVEP